MKEVQISKVTKEKAEAAKRYIQKKYSMNQVKAEQRAEQWKIFTQKISELQLSSKQEEQAKKQIIHEEMNDLRKRRQKISKKNFTSLSVIGRGAFGEVRLCRQNKSGRVVAIKCLKKKEMIKKNQQTHLRDERNILADGSEWIVKLLYSFQDPVCLYLVMQFLPGGDLMTLLINNNVINEESARFYIAETIIALQSVHKLNYIHRDLKPDNILIAANGHIKLSDFGLCKQTDINDDDDKHNYHKLKCKQSEHESDDRFQKVGIVSYDKMLKLKKRDRKLAFSAVGTPDYIAPQMLTRKGYDETVDWWSVGIMLYQMLIGYAPFTAENNEEIYYKIQNHNEFLYFPPQVDLSKEVVDLISRLVTKAEVRLGKHGGGEIKMHPWFKGIDWANIAKTKPPFVPEMTDDIDTKYFDDYDENQPWIFDGPESYRKDFNFVGYTYKDEEQNKNQQIFDNVFEKFEQEKVKEIEKEKFRLEGLRKNMKKKNNYGEGKNYVSRKVLEKSINLMNKSQICTERSKNAKSKSPICERDSIGMGKKKMTKSPLNSQKSTGLLKKTQLTYSSTLFQKTQQLPSRKSINSYK